MIIEETKVKKSVYVIFIKYIWGSEPQKNIQNLRENTDIGFGNNKRLSFNISGIHCVQVRNVPMFQVGTAITIMDQVNAKW